MSGSPPKHDDIVRERQRAEGELLRRILMERGIRQTELAKDLDVNINKVNGWTSGRQRMSNADKVAIVAAIGDATLTVANLTIVGSPSDSRAPDADEVTVVPRKDAEPYVASFLRGDMVRLPVWKAKAGLALDDEVWFEDQDTLPEEIPAFLTGGDYENHRIIRVSGLSMATRIDTGAKVIVRLSWELPPPGTIGVFQDDEKRLFLKTFRRSNSHGHPELHSINGSYPVINTPMLRGWQVRAVAVGIIHHYQGGPNIEWNFGQPLRA